MTVAMPTTPKHRFSIVDAHVGARVRSRRMQMGMSQTDLGSKLGISFQQIQKYEKGTNRISSSRLHQVASILQVATSYFFESQLGQNATEDGNPDAALLDEFCASRDGVALMQAFVKIRDAQTRQKIVKLVEGLARP